MNIHHIIPVRCCKHWQMVAAVSSILLSGLFFNTEAQTLQQSPVRYFKGTVYYQKADGVKEPLPFSQVYFMEGEKLLETDGNGQFTVNKALLGGRATLVATYVGYTRDTVVVTPDVESASFVLSGENDLEQAVVTGRDGGNSLSRMKSVRTEVISSAGLCKMACCALAESFENSASVTVGYSDAVTGARQIKLLGLSGTYTQMLDENRPVMRGLAAPFGLSFVPGQWLESIQIAKGPSSVVNGSEAITGQINMEHRKPTDETPLFVQLYGSSDAMMEANVASAVQMGPRWSVVNMAHIGGTASKMDHNLDGFRDEPEDLQLNFTSRWLYYAPGGLQVRFGARYLQDNRLGGQMDCTRDNNDNLDKGIWGSNIINRGIDGYLKVGVPLNEENSSNIAVVADVNHHLFDSFFGAKGFAGTQNSAFVNVIYRNEINDFHTIELGLTGKWDDLEQSYADALHTSVTDLNRKEGSAAAFGEYTLSLEDKLTFVGGALLEYNSLYGWLFTPRANLKYSFTDDIVFRLLGGRGYRTANLITDNLGILSTGSQLCCNLDKKDMLEDGWTMGGNITFYLPFGVGEDNTYLSLDYFRNFFTSQLIVDQEEYTGMTTVYNIDGLEGGRSFTNTYQADFSIEPLERFTVAATFRYTDAKVTLRSQGLVERPMTSRFKGVLNMQYSTAMSKWTFDFTAQLNGPVKLYRFAAETFSMETSPVYPMLYAQVTRKFRGLDIYVGGENLTNYRQKEAIIDASNPFGENFNASCIWGPLMGIKVYAGLRFTLWKM